MKELVRFAYLNLKIGRLCCFSTLQWLSADCTANQGTCFAAHADSFSAEANHYLCMASSGEPSANDTPKPTDLKTYPPLFKPAAGGSAADDWCIGTSTPALQVRLPTLLLPLPTLMHFSIQIAVMLHTACFRRQQWHAQLSTPQNWKPPSEIGALQMEI